MTTIMLDQSPRHICTIVQIIRWTHNIVLHAIIVGLQKDCAMPVMVLLVISSRLLVKKSHFLCIGHRISLCIGHCVCQGVEI